MKVIFLWFLIICSSVGSLLAQTIERNTITKDTSGFKKKSFFQDTSKPVKRIFNKNKNKISQKYNALSDSAKHRKANLKNTDDSLKSKYLNKKNRFRNSLKGKVSLPDSQAVKSAKGKITEKNKGINQKITIRKEKLTNLNDSTKKTHLKDSLKTVNRNKKEKLKQNLKEKREAVGEKIRHPYDTTTTVKEKIKSSIGTHGSVRSENYATDYLLPIQPGERNYSRLSGDVNLTLFNLPFDATFYVTTEKQTLYNANSFSLSFDPDQFKRNLEEKIRKRIKEKTEEQYKYKNDIKSKEAEL